MPYSTESIAERRPESQTIDAPLPISDIMSRRVPLAMTFDELLGTGDAPNETADELIFAVRQGRAVPSGGGRS